MKKVIDLKEKPTTPAKIFVEGESVMGTAGVVRHTHTMHCGGCGRTYTTSPCLGDYYCVGETEFHRKGCPQCFRVE